MVIKIYISADVEIDYLILTTTCTETETQRC